MNTTHAHEALSRLETARLILNDVMAAAKPHGMATAPIAQTIHEIEQAEKAILQIIKEAH